MPIGQIISVIEITDGPRPQMGPMARLPFVIHVRTTGGQEFIEISEGAATELRIAIGDGLLARYPTPTHEILELGHHEFVQRIQEVSLGLLEETGPLLRLHASIEAHPTKPPGPGRHQGATTLAIRMDQSVATELFRQIRALARTKGWQLPPTNESPA
jgi:hypothetical protein